MIEQDVINYLSNDGELDILLSTVAGNTKIFPNSVPLNITQPYIIYSTIGEGTLAEHLREISMSFDCVADNSISARNIRNRLIELLDHEDRIQKLITSTDYYVYWCKKTGGATFKEPDFDYYHNVGIYLFRYGILEQRYIDVINKTIVFHYAGTLIDEDEIVNGFRFIGNITITKVGLHCRTAPAGAAVTVDILKNSVEQGRIATLAAGSTAQITDITDTNILSTEDFGLKIKSVGSAFEGESMNVVVHYQ